MMKHIGVAAFVAVSLGMAGSALAQQQPEMGVAVRLMDPSGYPFGTALRPLNVYVTNQTASGGTTTTTSANIRTDDTTSTTAAPRDQSHDDTLAAAQAGAGLKTTAPAVAGVVAEQNAAVSTTAVTVGTAGTYRTMAYEPMGAPICATFGSGTLVAPSGGVCSVGSYVAAGVTVTYTAAVPGSVLRVISSGSATLWYQVQS